MQSSTISAARFPVAAPELDNAQDQSQRATAANSAADLEMGEIAAQEAPAQADDRELVRHQRSYEHWIKGAIGAGITGLGLYMFKLSILPGGESFFEKIRGPEGDHDALKHDLIDASLATTGGLLAMYDAYRVYRKDVAERRGD